MIAEIGLFALAGAARGDAVRMRVARPADIIKNTLLPLVARLR